MSKPQNLDTLVIQNQFYPKGLNEGQIYEYYQKNKQKILREVIGKNLTFYFATGLNKIVVMRKAKTSTGFLRLNYENYDEVITGRTISIHSNFKRDSEFGIIDIDIDDFEMAKKAVLEVYDLIETKCPFVNNVRVKYTGKESFHLLCYTRRIMDVDTFRLRMKKFLLESELNRNYTIERKRIKGVVNLDLSSNKYLGGYITLGALSVIGLQCLELKKEDVMKFKKEKAKI